MSEKTRGWLTVVGLIVGSASLGFTLYRTYVLEAIIERTAVARLTGLFTVIDPPRGTIVPAGKDVSIRGTFLDAIPAGYKVRAVVIAGDRFWVQRNRPNLVETRWSVSVRPSSGQWELGLCLVDEGGAAEMDKWAGERTRTGEFDWNNARPELPDGVRVISTFGYVASDPVAVQKTK
jgi:hypothetical protein